MGVIYSGAAQQSRRNEDLLSLSAFALTCAHTCDEICDAADVSTFFPV